MKRGLLTTTGVLVLGFVLTGCGPDAAAIESSIKASMSAEAALTATAETTSAATTTVPAETTAEETAAPTVPETTIDEAARREELINSVLSIESIRVSEPNSANGVDLELTMKNASDKEIKYLKPTVVFYNAVDDIVESSIGNYRNFGLEITGPIAAGALTGTDAEGIYWSAIIYNPAAIRAVVTGCTIEYMDGTKVVLSETDCRLIMPE